MFRQRIALDTETYKVTPGNLCPKLVCVSVSDGVRSTVLARQDGIKIARSLILDPKVELVGHHISYDMAVLARAAPDLLKPIFLAYRQGRIRDTMLRQQLMDIAQGTFEYHVDHEGKVKKTKYSLSEVNYRHYKQRLEKGADTWRMRYAELDGIPVSNWPAGARAYAEEDAHTTWKVALAQDIRAEIDTRKLSADNWDESYFPTEELQTFAAFALQLMGIWGLRANPARVAQFRRECLFEKAVYQKILIEEGIIKYEGGKYVKKDSIIREMVERAYKAKGLPVPMSESGKNISKDKDACEDSGDPLLKIVSAHIHVDKYISTYLPPMLIGCEVPFNPSWNTLVVSGRTSCGAEESPGNMQNLPRDGAVRPCWEARDGMVFCSTDLSVAELRSLAQVCLKLVGFSVMAEEFKKGIDPHYAFAADLLGITYEQIMANKNDKDVKDKRQFAKIWNFGAPGGMGIDGLVEYARGYGIKNLSRERAALYSKNWRTHYPEMVKYFALVKRLLNEDNRIKHCITGFVRGDVGFTDGCNHNFQHLTATISKDALVNITEECYTDEQSPLFGCRPASFVHDEVDTEMKEEIAHEAGFRQAELMEKSANKYVTDMPNPVEPALMKNMYKDAKMVFDANKRLAVWAPN